MIRILDDYGQLVQDALAVRYGASVEDWEAASDSKSCVEFIDGALVMHAAVSLTHGRHFGFLHRLLSNFVETRNLGEVLCGPFTMELDAERKFEPDIMFLSEETRGRLTEDRLRGPADFAIEIASPSTRGYDRGLKRECYAVGGVKEYWIVDPYDRAVIVDRPAGTEIAAISDGRVASERCPDFWIDAAWLWKEPLPKVQDCLTEILGEDRR